MANVKGGVIAAKKAASTPSAKKSMQDLILSMRPQIEAALPSVLTGERFSRMILSAMSSTPQLVSCTPQSFLGAMMQAAQLGVEPNTPIGQAYLIPYKNHGKLECQFQLGYKGLIDLVYRSGQVKDIQAHEVYENDEFEYELGLDAKLRHKPAMKDRGAVVAYYAVFHTKDGGYGFEVMSVADVKAHARKYSQSFSSNYSPWAKNFDEMAKKTVLKKCLKYAPLKTEFVRGIAADGTIKSTLAKDMVEIHDETEYTDIEATPVGDSGKENEPNVDMETGEVLPADHSDQPQSEDDKILEASLNM
ncbi:MAG: recombinase RecT [Megasphaera cerevisiae]|jgi:recombination protein RecT|nr:recombinase RecT [Megasphaera cerevisiae]